MKRRDFSQSVLGLGLGLGATTLALPGHAQGGTPVSRDQPQRLRLGAVIGVPEI